MLLYDLQQVLDNFSLYFSLIYLIHTQFIRNFIQVHYIHTHTHTHTNIENEIFITVVVVITAYAYRKRLKFFYIERRSCFIC